MATGRSPIRSLPYPLESDVPDVAADIEQLTTALDLSSRPTVTSLPGSPADGQEILFLADSTNGVVWTFRYRSGSVSSHKWEFIGGPPLYAEVQTQETYSTYSAIYNYGDLATVGPAITLPSIAGDFDVGIGAGIVGATQDAHISYAIGATAAVDADGAQANSGGGTANMISASRTRRKTGLSSGVTLTAKYRGDSGGSNPTFAYRWMSVLPVRVG